MKNIIMMTLLLTSQLVSADSFGGGRPSRPTCTSRSLKLKCDTNLSGVKIIISHRRLLFTGESKLPECKFDKDQPFDLDLSLTSSSQPELDDFTSTASLANGGMADTKETNNTYLFKANKKGFFITGYDIKTDALKNSAKGNVYYTDINDNEITFKLTNCK